MPVITKEVVAFGRKTLIGCDAQCDKAWGVNQRPKIQLSDNPDDYVFLADHEVGTAPVNPGTYEGGHGKPSNPEDRLNKWCFRECERSTSCRAGEPMIYPNFMERRYNMPQVSQK